MSFCKSTSKKSYKNTIFHRIIPGFMVQGGDYENGDGTGGEAFDGGTLEDECFDIKHDRPYILSMANRGSNTAGSQFFITLGKASHLDGKHVAFGHVVEGNEALRDMENVETDERDKPINMQKVNILDAGIGYGDDEESESDSLSTDNKSKKSKSTKKSKKSKKYDSYSDDDTSSSEHKKHRKKKHKKSKDSKKHKRKSRHGSEDSSDESDHKKRKYKDKDRDDDERDRERKRHKKHKRSNRHYSSDEDSDSSNDNHKKSKRRHKDKKSKRQQIEEQEESAHKHKGNSFGQFGIIRESDLRTSSKVQRNFEIWLEEVKGIPQGTNVPKWEMADAFKEYAEDFNTATLPHEKYYDYDKWELEEYNRKKEESKRKKGPISDEFEFQEERKKQAEDKRRRDLELVKMTMSKEKIEEMKRQSQLKAEMVNAYRVGDEKKRKKLQKRLEPDEK